MADKRPTTRRKPTSTPANAHLDDALFVPRLDLLSLPEGLMAGSGPDYEAVLESICGVVDDSQAVEQYDGTLGVPRSFVDAHQRPVAQVQWNDDLAAKFTNPGNVNGVRWGSGTMIGPDLFLSCGHLFDADPNGWTIPRQNGTSSAISPADVALNMHLSFDFQVDASGTQRPEQRFPITALVEYRLGGIDMSLCRVGGNPGTIFGWSEFATTNPAVGDMLAIIGHPAGMPKRVEAGPASSVSFSTLTYDDIDTLGGNSGSGILHGPTGRVVGVHTNGGCNSGGTGANSGVAIAQIIAVSPTLASLTPSSRTAKGEDLIATTFARDSIGTILGGDTGQAEDTIATSFAADHVGTILGGDTGLRDQIGTSLAGDLGTSVAGDLGTFAGGDDPGNTRAEGVVDPGTTLVEGIFDPGSVVIDPIGPVVVQRQRPFVQAGPSLQVQDAPPRTLGDAVVAEVEGLIAANAAVAQSLQALRAALTSVEGR